LKPGGWAILQVPFFAPIPDVTFEDNSITDPRERERVFGQDDHVRLFGKDYTKRIERAGLKAEESNFATTVSERFGVQNKEVLYVASKQ
ncbi:MAG: SAM-dependent methyltransferase, partial [Cyclobacteriaceae bacterium]